MSLVVSAGALGGQAYRNKLDSTHPAGSRALGSCAEPGKADTKARRF